ncbi:aminopeptidase N [Cellulomonas hominis]|uniref:Aminopeptidase N n=1 Tax=Cellulomonas hominis TaxID=156981 RepID=A0A511FAI7_9CELL|nr:aminopeptidase N [Cellulomonas hominis]MBB5471449.1 aminopeptidase N [Cellulomonas hominis]GEL46279.1 aminopeptidase N [Cellulomonas hominis]
MPAENLTRDEARTRAALVDVQSYDVTLDLTTGPATFGSTTTVRFTSREAGASTFLDLIAPSVHRVVLNGVELDPSDVVADSRIRLDGLAAENEVVVVADCAYMNTGEGLHRFVDPVDDEVYLYSQFEVADSRRVFAVFEQPDLKATFAFTVTAPAHWVVVSNSPEAGAPVPVEGGANRNGGADHGSATWTFEPTPRISSYITAVVAGPYHHEHGELTSSDGRTIPLGVYCRGSLAQHLDTDNILDITRAGFAFYEEQFAFPYPFAKYDQLFVPEFNAGAMENAGAVTFLESYVFRSKVPEATVERRAVTILHELAHMWFGDLVTMRWWDDLWLNESFAEFASTLATAEATRWTSAWTTFSSLEKGWAYRQDQLPSTHPIAADIRDLEDVEVNFDGITYAKGASVLKQLVAWVGQDQFFAGVRQYFQKHAWGNTELRDLLTELEATSGRDLSAWSALWLEQSGVTLLRPEIASEIGADGVERITALAVRQEVPETHPVQRPHRLVVGGYDVVDGRLERVQRVELDVDGERTEVPALVGEKRPDLLLLNDDDLAYAKVRLDERSLATAIAHLGGFTQSLPRTLVWAAVWDATRDGETPARDYVDLLLGNIAHETDSSVVLVLLRQLHTALDLYVAAEHRTATEVAAADRLWTLATDAPGGSDTQLQLVKAFALRASTPEQLDAVAALLDGGTRLDGLSIDTDLRWELLTSLVTGGRAGAAEIDAQLEADPTATGQRAAAAARAAIPTADAKAAAWAAVVESDALPNALQAATIGGFGRVHDRALLRPYVAPYFEVLETVWAGKTNEMAQNIVTGLYPTELADDAEADVAGATDAWLAAHPDAAPALRRLVVEARDGVRRTLAAQAADRHYHEV